MKGLREDIDALKQDVYDPGKLKASIKRTQVIADAMAKKRLMKETEQADAEIAALSPALDRMQRHLHWFWRTQVGPAFVLISVALDMRAVNEKIRYDNFRLLSS